MRPQKQEEPPAARLEEQKNEELENCDKAICSMCNVKNVSQKDILLHKISTHHVKKWRSGIRLQSQCMACSVTLSDIKAADTHVQGSGHEHQMICNFKQGSFIDWIYKCPPCGLAFHCSFALELHLVMTHKVTFSSENLPDVVNVVQLLSGSSADASANIDLKCFICQMTYEAMDDFVVHLFSNTHVQSLRVSACIACEKKFIHVRDREEHLRASKHRVRVQKSCLSNKLRKVKDNGQLERAGYLCMYCMVWCKSWPCLMVHLLDSSHSFYAARQDQQHTNQIQHNMLKASDREAIEDIPYPSTSGRNWRRWLDQPVGLSAWCNVCEEIFPSPEATEKHLEDHHDLQIIHARKKSNSSNCLTYTGQKCDCFECELCCVIFKSPLALTVHKAFPQHHIQHHRMFSGRNSCYCFDCRRQRRSAAFEKSVVPKSKPANVGDLQQNMANIENHLTKSWKSDTKQETADKCFNMDEFEATRKNKHPLLDSIIKEKGTPFEVVQKGEMDSKNLGTVCADNCTRDSSLPVIEPLEPGGNAGRDTRAGTSEQHLRETTVECQKKDRPDCHEPIDSGIPVGSNEMIPVVIAAALPSSEPISSSLQSAMKLVTQSLFAALPKIRKPSTEVCSGRKRPRNEMYNSPANNNEDTNLGAILEAAVFEGLQSLNSGSSQSEAPAATRRQQGDTKGDQNPGTSTGGTQTSLGVPSASISIKTEHGIPVVLAATFLPEASSAEAPSPPCPRTEPQTPLPTDPHERAMDKACDDKVQNIDGSRRESLEADAVQEQDKEANPVGNQSGENPNQPLVVVYEEDSSSDDDADEWGYVSPDNSESSEDEY